MCDAPIGTTRWSPAVKRNGFEEVNVTWGSKGYRHNLKAVKITAITSISYNCQFQDSSWSSVPWLWEESKNWSLLTPPIAVESIYIVIHRQTVSLYFLFYLLIMGFIPLKWPVLSSFLIYQKTFLFCFVFFLPSRLHRLHLCRGVRIFRRMSCIWH